VAGVALSLAVATQARASASVQGLVLTKSDVPLGCRLRVGQVVSNSYVEHSRSLTPAQVRSYGRITGYGEAFTCSGTGIISISSEAVEFSQATGAHRYYALVVAGDLRQVQRYGSFRRLTTAALGQEATAFTYEARVLSSGNALRLFALELIRRGRYLGTVEVDGPVGTWKTSVLTSLMRVMDTRMKSAH
jgi:hypothetical protein